MRDLYKLLDVAPTDGQAELGAAVRAAHDPDLRRDASYVLLDPARRRRYDSVRAHVIQIEHLSQMLALSQSQGWATNTTAQFRTRPSSRGRVGRLWLSAATVLVCLVTAATSLQSIMPQVSDLLGSGENSDHTAPKVPVTGPLSTIAGFVDTAPLRIINPSTKDVVLRLVGSTTPIWLYVRAGDSLTVDVPAAKYQLFFGAGRIWLDKQRRFDSGPIVATTSPDTPLSIRSAITLSISDDGQTLQLSPTNVGEQFEPMDQ